MTRNLNWRDVPLPERMKALDRDKRGLPIPFLVIRGKDGIPAFTVNDSSKHATCLREDRCAVCGQHLLRGRWFTGGPLSAFHEMGCYIDTPLHKECMEYAMQVCPYLGAPKYNGRLDDAMIDYSQFPEHMLLVDSTSIPERPPLFVSVMATKQKVWTHQLQVYVKPMKPYSNIQYWLHGERISIEAGEGIVTVVLREQADMERLQAPKVTTRGGSEKRDRL